MTPPPILTATFKWRQVSALSVLGHIPTNRDESNPIRLTNMQHRLFGLLKIAMHENAYTLAESRVEAPKSCQVKNLDAVHFIFVSRTPLTEHDGCYFATGNEPKKYDSLAQDHPAIHNASHCEHRNRNHTARIL